METVTARELKNRTGAVLRRVRDGSRILVTRHGHPVALIVSPDMLESATQDEARPFDEAWEEIERALAESEPPYPTWQEAMRTTRCRP